MAGKRFKDTEKKLNMKKVLLILIMPIIVVLGYFGYKEIPRLLESYNVTRVATVGYYAYKNEQGKWGVINGTGETVIPNEYDEMIVIPKKDKDVFIVTEVTDYTKKEYTNKVLNAKGTQIFKEFDKIEPIEYNSSETIYDKNVLKCYKNGKIGLIDYEGNVKFEPEFQEVSTMGNISEKLLIKKEDKYGVINTKTYSYAVPNIYKSIEPIDNTDNNTNYDVVFESLHGVMTENGKKVIATEYDEVLKIKSSTHVAARKGNDRSLFNINGEKVSGYMAGIKEVYEDVVIYETAGKLGVKSLAGKEILKPEYTEIKKISKDKYITKKEKYNIVSVSEGTEAITATELLQKEAENIQYYKEGAFYIAEYKEDNTTKESFYNSDVELKLEGKLLEYNGNDGYMRVLKANSKEEEFYNFKFEHISEESAYKTNNLFRFVENGKVGFKNNKGTVIVPAIYDDATYQNIYGFIAVNRSGKWGSLDYNGKIVVEPQYELKDYTYIDFIKDMYRYKDADIVAYTK